MAIVFDGNVRAAERETLLKEKVAQTGQPLRLVSFVFVEDEASLLYTRLKSEAAARVGIAFERSDHHFDESVETVVALIATACAPPDVTGVLIQKPSKAVWQRVSGKTEGFVDWWHMLTGALDPAKDVDGLTGKGRLVPATVQACLLILDEALPSGVAGKKVVVVGQSDIVGEPLANALEQRQAVVTRGTSKTPDLISVTQAAEVVISATGRKGLITGEMVREGVVVLDVGSPGADVDYDSVLPKASFITPVPNGVGPMTVVCLLENVVALAGV